MVDKTSTIPELRAYAKKNKINLEGATKKSEILKKLKIKTIKGGKKKRGARVGFGSSTGRLNLYTPVKPMPKKPLQQQNRYNYYPSVQTHRPSTSKFTSPPPNALPIPSFVNNFKQI